MGEVLAKNIFKITLIRHAPTAYGEHNQFMGRLDVPCSERGKSEARAASKNFFDIKYFRIFCSPLSRAIQTTECLFPGLNYIVDNNLIERDLGSWAGKYFTTINREYPEAFLESGNINPWYTPKDGEPIENVVLRAKGFLQMLLVLFNEQKTDGQYDETLNIAIITHNGVIRVMKYLLDKTPISDLFIENEKHLHPTIYSFDGKRWYRTMK